MGKQRWPPGDGDLIRIILLRLPIVSLLRFKSVSKSWRSLIQSFFFIHLHTTTNNNTTLNSSSSSSSSSSSNSNKFGSFILHAAVDSERFRENALLMLSSVSESESSESGSVSLCSGFFGLWSTGFNGICGRCVSGGYKSATDFKFGTGGLWWRTNDGLCGVCWNPHNFVDEDQVFKKIDNSSFLVSDDDDQQQQQQQHQQQQHQQQLVLKLDNLGFPSCYNFGKIKPIVMVVGSCNGLICLHDSERGDVSLWNPATRQFRILPKSITFDGGDCLHHRLLAFGFDAKTKDYKVVLLSGLRLRPRIIDGLSVGPMECLCRVQVYSLSTDSWRLLEGINVLPGSPFHYPDSPGLLYLNGSCFFMSKSLYSEHCSIPLPKDNDRFIISLDLTKEIITPIQLPHHCGSEELYLCYLGDKIALFTATKRYCGTDCWKLFRILVLNEHCNSNRNNKSWIQLRSFGIKHGLPGEWIIPRGISNDGVFVFLETGIHETGIHGLDKKKMKLYNLVTREVKKNFIYSDQVLSEAYAYKPSLVSIIGGNGCSSSSYVIE